MNSQISDIHHDHDRVNDSHVLIADIVEDQVFMVNTETEVIVWAWDAQSEFPVEGGGPYPEDWAHINDVTLLEDGRVMVSLRNQDQVVFLDRETGMIDDQTLGEEDDYDTLYEQHNPDYIPEENGGPAVLVADSENARVVEYQLEDGDWNQSWEWSDEQMQWPRDADRLPNGNTLIADTNGKRLLEVDPEGYVEWMVPVTHPYDVERLGTGDESEGGESARRLGLVSRTADRIEESAGPLGYVSAIVKALFPPQVVNGAIYLSPPWVDRPQFFAAGVGLVVGLTWIALEIRWRVPRIGFRWPIYRREG